MSFLLIGLAVAYFACYSPESKRESADAKIAILASYDLGWVYLGIFFVKLLQLPIAIILGTARKQSKAGLPNQHVYKVMGAEGSKLGYVLMENEGDHGKFNRAQRALMNYCEVFPSVALLFVAAGVVFPADAFTALMLFSVTKIIGAIGYTEKGAEGRQSGAALNFLSINTLNGMVLIAAYKSLKWKMVFV